MHLTLESNSMEYSYCAHSNRRWRVYQSLSIGRNFQYCQVSQMNLYLGTMSDQQPWEGGHVQIWP